MTLFAIGLLAFAAIGALGIVLPEAIAFFQYLRACARRWFD